MIRVAPCIYVNNKGTGYLVKLRPSGAMISRAHFPSQEQAQAFIDGVRGLSEEDLASYLAMLESKRTRKKRDSNSVARHVYRRKKGTFFVHYNWRGVSIHKSGFKTVEEASAYVAEALKKIGRM